MDVEGSLETRTFQRCQLGQAGSQRREASRIDKGMRLLRKRQLPVGYEGQTGLTWEAVGALGGGWYRIGDTWETAPEEIRAP